MNFKRFHESRNMIDADTVYSDYKQADGTYLGTVNNFYTAHVTPFTSDDIGKTFTFTIVVKKTTSTNVRASANINGASVNGNNLSTAGTTTVTFTVSSINDYLYLGYGGGGANQIILDNIMLNTGSTPLPYEPYSSEVWHDTPHYIHKTATDTLTTLPAVVYPNAATATVGLKGNTVQSSTPSPTSPVMPQGTGERTGDLLPFDDKNFVITAGNSNLTVECKNGNLFMQGNAGEIGSGQVVWKNNFAFELEAGTYYCNSPAPLGQGFGRYIKKYDDNTTILTSTNYMFTLSEKTKCYLSFYIYQKNIDSKIELMLNSGSTALPYEPYGNKIPISSAGQTNNIYLGEVETTRKIKKLVLTGEEKWIYRSGNPANVFFIPVSPAWLSGTIALSTAYPYYTGTDFPDMNDKEFAIIRNYLSIRNSDYRYESQFKAYLAQQYATGTPVTVWYVLATEEIGIVNEPLMKIGDYTDTLSNVSIPVTAGGDTLSVGTTVQPSEVTATYKGWHPVADVHERDSNYTIATMQALTISQLQTHTISDLQGGEWS